MSLTQVFNQDGTQNIGTAASVTTGLPTYTTGTYAALSLTTTGLLRVDASNTTVPISATTLPLPTGASTSALQTTGNTTLTAISAQLPATLGQTTMSGSLAVVIASNQTAIPVTITTSTSTTGTLTSVAAAITSTTLLASNVARKEFIVYNDSLNILYVAFAATASTTAFSYKLQPGSGCETGAIDYTGIITGIWSAASGSARMTEFT